MEVPTGKNNKAIVCLYEALGTAFLINSVNWSGNPVAIPITLFCNIVIFGDITGGHFNPAVTLAVFVREGKDKMKENIGFCLMIITSEILGAILGVIISYGGMTGHHGNFTPMPGLLCPKDESD